MAARLSARLLSRQVRLQACRRQFTSSASLLDAQNFSMPALSPTMTEGNIATWKLKEGDSFQPGDVLLEIETDKATMDVEAQDAGVLVKIFANDGEKAVQVGSRIAVIGEEGDDPKSLEIPSDDSKPQSDAKDSKQDKPEPPREESKTMQQKSEPSEPSKKSTSSAPAGPGQNKKYPLYPSVAMLIHENHISESDVSKIPATGPAGRLLKGDVLAYLGDIAADYSSKQSKRLEHLSHLDLSSIKIAGPAAPNKPATAPEASLPTLPELPPLSEVALPISLSAVLATQKRIEDTLGVSISLSTLLARATDIANAELPRTKASMSTSQDDLFNAVLGLEILNPKSSHGAYIPQIEALPISTFGASPLNSRRKTTTKPDIIDILSGKARQLPTMISSPKSKSMSSASAQISSASGGAVNMFSLTVPKGEEKRARTFLERLKTVLHVEPGRLVL